MDLSSLDSFEEKINGLVNTINVLKEQRDKAIAERADLQKKLKQREKEVSNVSKEAGQLKDGSEVQNLSSSKEEEIRDRIKSILEKIEKLQVTLS